MKHIAIDLHFVRDYVVKGFLQVHHASSHDQLADLLAKALPHIRFTHLQTKIDIIDSKPILWGRVKNQAINQAPSVTTKQSAKENQAISQRPKKIKS
jgi:hypothetical protein